MNWFISISVFVDKTFMSNLLSIFTHLFTYSYLFIYISKCIFKNCKEIFMVNILKLTHKTSHKKITGFAAFKLYGLNKL